MFWEEGDKGVAVLSTTGFVGPWGYEAESGGDTAAALIDGFIDPKKNDEEEKTGAVATAAYEGYSFGDSVAGESSPTLGLRMMDAGGREVGKAGVSSASWHLWQGSVEVVVSVTVDRLCVVVVKVCPAEVVVRVMAGHVVV